MTKRVLTLRELNRALLARQMLLERASMSALDGVECLVGLQAQLSDPPYIGLWTRLHAFQHNELTGLVQQRQVVRATMMRSTLHLMTTEDYVTFRPVLQPALTRAMHAFFGKPAKSLDVVPLVAVTQEYVREQPRTFVEIRAMLVEHFPDVDPALLAYAVRTHLPLVQVPPGGIWGFTGSPSHAEASAWFGRSLDEAVDGLETLILRYLSAFGPATVRDIQVWSGLTRLNEAVDAVKSELVVLRDEKGNELLDLPDSVRPSADMEAPPRFLPEFDNVILSHADRTRIVSDEYRRYIFLSAGRVRATFLLDGFVAGTWKIEKLKNMARLVIEPFKQLSEVDREALVEEGERLVRFVEENATSFEVQVVVYG